MVLPGYHVHPEVVISQYIPIQAMVVVMAAQAGLTTSHPIPATVPAMAAIQLHPPTDHAGYSSNLAVKDLYTRTATAIAAATAVTAVLQEQNTADHKVSLPILSLATAHQAAVAAAEE